MSLITHVDLSAQKGESGRLQELLGCRFATLANRVPTSSHASVLQPKISIDAIKPLTLYRCRRANNLSSGKSYCYSSPVDGEWRHSENLPVDFSPRACCQNATTDGFPQLTHPLPVAGPGVTMKYSSCSRRTPSCRTIPSPPVG